MKDHEIREATNELRDIAITYRDAEQLRSRMSGAVHSIVEKCKPKMKKVEDLKIGDRIKIVSVDFFKKRDMFATIYPQCKTGCASIMDIGPDEEGDIRHTLHFEGDYKGATYSLDLNCYQTEFEVLGNNVLKGSPNKQTLSNPSDYSTPIYFE